MARLSESAASLRFFGDNLDPEKLTRLLGSEPSIGRRKGESRRNATKVRICATVTAFPLERAGMALGW